MNRFSRLKAKPGIVTLLSARGLRTFGDGFGVIILPAYLSALGFSTFEIGFATSAALLGTAALTLTIGFIAPRYELRHLFLAGAGLIVFTGLAFPMVETIVPIVIVSFIGSINASAGDVGMMIPLEHSALARESADHDRTRLFARYSLIGALMASIGALAASLPDIFVKHGLTHLTALRVMFYAYALLGLTGMFLYSRLPQDHAHAEATPKTPLGPSRHIVYRLAVLFGVDAFGGGFIAQSLMALWLFKNFNMSLSAASLYFFWAGLLTSSSHLAAARISQRIGLINTMVITQVSSSLCLIAAAFAPSLSTVLTLLSLRALLSQMDIPTRSSYVVAVVTPPERPAAASVTIVARSLCQSISPAIAGALFAGPFSGLPLVIAGSLKLAYNGALLAMFRTTRPPEEKPANLAKNGLDDSDSTVSETASTAKP
jgi:MFS family permease